MCLDHSESIPEDQGSQNRFDPHTTDVLRSEFEYQSGTKAVQHAECRTHPQCNTGQSAVKGWEIHPRIQRQVLEY